MGAMFYAMVVVGTVGLLVGEFVEFDRALILGFALVNVIGLIGVGVRLFSSRSDRP
jgi:hypothetical protein